MRIAHVITRLIVGGAQENTVASVAGLRARAGLEVELISGPTAGREGTLLPWLEARAIPVTVLPDLIRPVHPVRDLRCLQRLTTYFRQTSPDLVHTHSGKAGLLGRWAARRAGVPIIVHTIHGPSFGPFQGPVANLTFTWAERFAGRMTDHFVTVSDAMTEQYLAAGIGTRMDYTRVWSGFDLGPFLQATPDPALRAQLGLVADDFVIGKIARLTTLKGHDELVQMLPELVRRCPRAKLLLVGDGPLRASVESALRQAGLQSRVCFAGLVPPDEVARYVGLMDVLVHLSFREGLPRALPQAMAAGRPVVAYDCDGAREVCRTGETGFLIPARDQAAAVARLVELGANPALRQKLGQGGRALVQERFSVHQMVEDLHQLYVRLARERARPGQAGALPASRVES